MKAQTRVPGAAADAPGTRPRPAIHFTADDGWINDPYGIVWSGDRYHLFYQAIRGRVTWAPNCSWGHAVSPDLVHWAECPPALTPQPFELGCWSGSVVAQRSGLRLFYTRVTGSDWSRGAIATATADGAAWTSTAADVLVSEPPAELGVQTFRDPFVFRHGAEWVMVVGAGLADGTAAAVHYHSADLRTWTCDGLLAVRPSSASGDVWTGAVWECPQLFPLGDIWVLLVSVWDDDVLHYVAAATGDYDGRRFEPHRWQRLTWGTCAYAASAFADRDGHRCVMSWLREEPQNDPSLTVRAGAHSIAARLTYDDGRLTLTPHPDVVARASARWVAGAESVDTEIPTGGAAVLLALRATPGPFAAVTAGSRRLALLEIDAGETALRIIRPGRPDGFVPIASGAELQLLVDADLLEVFGAGGYGAFRIGVEADPVSPTLVLHAPHPAAQLRRLSDDVGSGRD